MRDFEEAFTNYIGASHGIALANGSLALELCLLALGVGPGDEVIVTPRSFVASAHCVRMVGARPVFADVDPVTGNISADTIARVLTDRSRAIVPVHFAGWPADMPAIMSLAHGEGLKVIEDCAQAHGAQTVGRRVGSFGDAAAFSFCQDKIMSTGGEGGLATFRDFAASEWARSFKDHGKNFDKLAGSRAVTPGKFQFMVDQVGTNWRMTAMQAAIGLVQLSKLEQWLKLRARNAAVWARALDGLEGIRVPRPLAPASHAFYKFICYVDLPEPVAAHARDQILITAAARGLRVFSGGCSEIYRENAYDGPEARALPNAKALGDTSLMMEVHPTLDHSMLKRRAQALQEIVEEVLAEHR